jgi:hypothetical protein
MVKYPIIKKEESFFEVTVGNGGHFDVHTVNHLKKENTGYLKIYVSEQGKVKIYINKDDYDVEILDWEGHLPFQKQVDEDEEIFYAINEMESINHEI